MTIDKIVWIYLGTDLDQSSLQINDHKIDRASSFNNLDPLVSSRRCCKTKYHKNRKTTCEALTHSKIESAID